jgi:hypothetical protein
MVNASEGVSGGARSEAARRGLAELSGGGDRLDRKHRRHQAGESCNRRPAWGLPISNWRLHTAESYRQALSLQHPLPDMPSSHALTY